MKISELFEADRLKTPGGLYTDKHTGVKYSTPTGHGGHYSYMTPAYMLQYYKERLQQIEGGPFKRAKEVAQLKAKIAKLEKQAK